MPPDRGVFWVKICSLIREASLVHIVVLVSHVLLVLSLLEEAKVFAPHNFVHAVSLPLRLNEPLQYPIVPLPLRGFQELNYCKESLLNLPNSYSSKYSTTVSAAPFPSFPSFCMLFNSFRSSISSYLCFFSSLVVYLSAPPCSSFCSASSLRMVFDLFLFAM